MATETTETTARRDPPRYQRYLEIAAYTKVGFLLLAAGILFLGSGAVTPSIDSLTTGNSNLLAGILGVFSLTFAFVCIILIDPATRFHNRKSNRTLFLFLQIPIWIYTLGLFGIQVHTNTVNIGSLGYLMFAVIAVEVAFVVFSGWSCFWERAGVLSLAVLDGLSAFFMLKTPRSPFVLVRLTPDMDFRYLPPLVLVIYSAISMLLALLLLHPRTHHWRPLYKRIAFQVGATPVMIFGILLGFSAYANHTNSLPAFILTDLYLLLALMANALFRPRWARGHDAESS